MRTIQLVPLLLAAGCGFSTDFEAPPPDSRSESDDTDDTEEVVDDGCLDGFADVPLVWTLPPGYGATTFALPYDANGSSSPNWTLADLGGTGRSQIVVTRHEEITDDIGSTEWWLYGNTTTSFGSSPVSWKLPSGFPDAEFRELSDTTESPMWALLDLSGDGLVEVVLTEHDDIGGALGVTEWWTYSNGGEGFTESPAVWKLPTGFGDDVFRRVYDANSASPSWGLVDLDGDGQRDLVMTRHDEISSTIGTAEWWVYANTGEGFEASPVTWSLPAGYETYTFERLTDASSSSPNWVLLDIDGDDAVEMVLTRNDEISSIIGTTEWWYYDNVGNGFSDTAQTWPLPEGFGPGQFHQAYDTSSTTPTWTIADLNADKKPDVVLTQHTDISASIGTSEWWVYVNTGSRFASQPSSFPLLPGYAEGTFQQLTDVSSAAPNWLLDDLDGDGLLDMVMTQDPENDASVGTSHWAVYPGRCD